MTQKVLVSEDVHVLHGESEALIELDITDDFGDMIVVVPMDDCMIEVKWSDEYRRLVAVVKVIPQNE